MNLWALIGCCLKFFKLHSLRKESLEIFFPVKYSLIFSKVCVFIKSFGVTEMILYHAQRLLKDLSQPETMLPQVCQAR